MGELFGGILRIDFQVFRCQLVMWVIGGVLIYLAIRKNMEPTLLLPMGFGAILMNIPNNTDSEGGSKFSRCSRMRVSQTSFPHSFYSSV